MRPLRALPGSQHPLALLMGKLRHGAKKELRAQMARPGQAHLHPVTLHHSAPDNHNCWGLGGVLNSPLPPQQAAGAGAASGLNVVLLQPGAAGGSAVWGLAGPVDCGMESGLCPKSPWGATGGF